MGGSLGTKAAELGTMFGYASTSEVTALNFTELRLDCDRTDVYNVFPQNDQVSVLGSLISLQQNLIMPTTSNVTHLYFFPGKEDSPHRQGYSR